jgi:ribosome-associated protein
VRRTGRRGFWYPAARPTLPETHIIEAIEFAQDLAQIAHDKQGTDIVLLDIAKSLGIADYFVIITARNPRHAQAIGTEVQFQMKHRGHPPLRASGIGADNRWVLLDFGEAVVHVFLAEARAFYGLENLWADAPRVAFQPADASGAPTSATQ